jgi:hypothetical protein
MSWVKNWLDPRRAPPSERARLARLEEKVDSVVREVSILSEAAGLGIQADRWAIDDRRAARSWPVFVIVGVLALAAGLNVWAAADASAAIDARLSVASSIRNTAESTRSLTLNDETSVQAELISQLQRFEALKSDPAALIAELSGFDQTGPLLDESKANIQKIEDSFKLDDQANAIEDRALADRAPVLVRLTLGSAVLGATISWLVTQLSWYPRQRRKRKRNGPKPAAS